MALAFRRWLDRLIGRDPSPDGRRLFIDDVTIGGWELLPASASDWCAEQFRQIAAVNARARRADGSGWSDLHVRPKPPFDLAALRMPMADACASLARSLPEFAEVVTGDANRPQPIARARGYGPSPLCAVVLYASSPTGAVEQIELVLNGSRADAARVLAALADIPTAEPLLLIDWYSGRAARLDQPAAIEAILAPA